MTHKIAEPYSGKNPVPTITTKLTSLVNPEKATEAKAQQLQDQSVKREEKNTEKTASRLSKGHVMHVTDPTTGEELDIRNADEDPDTRSKGDNVLHQPFPPPGEYSECSSTYNTPYETKKRPLNSHHHPYARIPQIADLSS